MIYRIRRKKRRKFDPLGTATDIIDVSARRAMRRTASRVKRNIVKAIIDPISESIIDKILPYSVDNKTKYRVITHIYRPPIPVTRSIPKPVSDPHKKELSTQSKHSKQAVSDEEPVVHVQQSAPMFKTTLPKKRFKRKKSKRSKASKLMEYLHSYLFEQESKDDVKPYIPFPTIETKSGRLKYAKGVEIGGKKVGGQWVDLPDVPVTDGVVTKEQFIKSRIESMKIKERKRKVYDLLMGVGIILSGLGVVGYLTRKELTRFLLDLARPKRVRDLDHLVQVARSIRIDRYEDAKTAYDRLNKFRDYLNTYADHYMSGMDGLHIKNYFKSLENSYKTPSSVINRFINEMYNYSGKIHEQYIKDFSSVLKSNPKKLRDILRNIWHIHVGIPFYKQIRSMYYPRMAQNELDDISKKILYSLNAKRETDYKDIKDFIKLESVKNVIIGSPEVINEIEKKVGEISNIEQRRKQFIGLLTDHVTSEFRKLKESVNAVTSVSVKDLGAKLPEVASESRDLLIESQRPPIIFVRKGSVRDQAVLITDPFFGLSLVPRAEYDDPEDLVDLYLTSKSGELINSDLKPIDQDRLNRMYYVAANTQINPGLRNRLLRTLDKIFREKKVYYGGIELKPPRVVRSENERGYSLLSGSVDIPETITDPNVTKYLAARNLKITMSKPPKPSGTGLPKPTESIIKPPTAKLPKSSSQSIKKLPTELTTEENLDLLKKKIKDIDNEIVDHEDQIAEIDAELEAQASRGEEPDIDRINKKTKLESKVKKLQKSKAKIRSEIKRISETTNLRNQQMDESRIPVTEFILPNGNIKPIWFIIPEESVQELDELYVNRFFNITNYIRK